MISCIHLRNLFIFNFVTNLILSLSVIAAEPTNLLSQNNQKVTSQVESDKIDDLIKKASDKILKKLNGVVPDNLKDRVEKELNKQISSDKGEKLLSVINEKIPSNLREKLPVDLLNKVSGVKITKIEKINYYPQLPDLAHQLNLYLPPIQNKKFPLIIFIHGGGWQSRPKSTPNWLNESINNGYAVACVNYRLSSEGIFPAQVEDLNTALRFLKENANKINVDPDKVGLFGQSAGGHLAALMGTGWNNSKLDLGWGNKSISRKVAAVCDWYGPTNLYELGTKTYLGQKWDLNSQFAPLSLFLGGQASQKKALAEEASPITYVSKNSPAFFIMHGATDDIIPVSQSQELVETLKQNGVSVIYNELPGVGHGFQDKKYMVLTRQFFDKYLK